MTLFSILYFYLLKLNYTQIQLVN